MIVVISCGWLKLMFNPSGLIVCNHAIHLSSLCSRSVLSFILSAGGFSRTSMIVNRACWVKLWLGNWKCLSQGVPASRHTSFLCVLILVFICFSLFPTYCLFLHSVHSMRYIRFFDLQLLLWKILYSLLVMSLLNLFVDFICLQHRFPDLPKHGSHLFISLVVDLYGIFLLFSILLLPM